MGNRIRWIFSSRGRIRRMRGRVGHLGRIVERFLLHIAFFFFGHEECLVVYNSTISNPPLWFLVSDRNLRSVVTSRSICEFACVPKTRSVRRIANLRGFTTTTTVDIHTWSGHSMASVQSSIFIMTEMRSSLLRCSKPSCNANTDSTF